LLYIKNVPQDEDLVALNGGTVLPIGWFWERVGEANGTYTYFALGLMLNWLFYALVSAVEFIAWVLYLNGSDYFAAWWFSTIGYWGSIIGLPLPWIFMSVYIGDTLKGVTNVFPGTWAIFVLVMTLLMWITFATLHIVYVPDFLAHIAALPKPKCKCSLPLVTPAAEDASEEEKAAVKRAEDEREYLCSYECKAKAGDCPLAKEEGQSQAEYEAACAALAEQAEAKAEEEAPSLAIPEDESEAADEAEEEPAAEDEEATDDAF